MSTLISFRRLKEGGRIVTSGRLSVTFNDDPLVFALNEATGNYSAQLGRELLIDIFPKWEDAVLWLALRTESITATKERVARMKELEIAI